MLALFFLIFNFTKIRKCKKYFKYFFRSVFFKDCVIFETIQRHKYDTLQLGIESDEVGLALKLCYSQNKTTTCR